MATAELIGNAAQGDDLAWVAVSLEVGRIASARGEGEGAAELCRAVRGTPSRPSTTRSGRPAARGPPRRASPSR